MEGNWKIATIISKVNPQNYGRKAYWLSWLHKEGYRVPYAIFLPAKRPNFFSKRSVSFLRKVLIPFQSEGYYDVAIRSSSTIEDSSSKSYAGHFRTFLGRMTFEEVVQRINEVSDAPANLKKVSDQIGVIIQRRIEANFSGITFSSDPLTADRRRSIVTVVSGTGSRLVSGEVSGEDISVTIEGDNYEISHYQHDIPPEQLKGICRIGKEIENKVGKPVDLEWCVDAATGDLNILQCRPITGIFPPEPLLIEVDLAIKEQIPDRVLNSEKVALRLDAQRLGVAVSKAHLIIGSFEGGLPRVPDIRSLFPTRECRAYSVVVLYPRRLSGKVMRAFVNSSKHERRFLRKCERYSIRAYPTYKSIRECVEKLIQTCGLEYWLTILIIQEILDPEYSGILKRLPDGYVIEIARGHFIPKGVVPTSRYLLNSSCEKVISRNEVRQDECFRILDGHVVEEEIPPLETLVSLSEDLLQLIVETFKPFLQSTKRTIEFGVLKKEKEVVPYLIDLVEDGSISPLDVTDISEGILSRGTRTGVIDIPSKHDNIGFMQRHFHDMVGVRQINSNNRIFVCDRPDISLLQVLENFDPNRVGFIFKEGSVLCHLAIILRERGIPAVVMGDEVRFEPGEVVTVDASTSSLCSKDRVYRHAE